MPGGKEDDVAPGGRWKSVLTPSADDSLCQGGMIGLSDQEEVVAAPPNNHFELAPGSTRPGAHFPDARAG
jgi:hypothetical protein